MQYANKHLNGDVWCVSLVVQSKSHITYACGAQLSLSVWSQRMRDEVRYTHLRLPKLETPYINSIQFNSMPPPMSGGHSKGPCKVGLKLSLVCFGQR